VPGAGIWNCGELAVGFRPNFVYSGELGCFLLRGLRPGTCSDVVGLGLVFEEVEGDG